MGEKTITLNVGGCKIDLTGKKDVYGEIYNIVRSMYLTIKDGDISIDTPIYSRATGADTLDTCNLKEFLKDNNA